MKYDKDMPKVLLQKINNVISYISVEGKHDSVDTDLTGLYEIYNNTFLKTLSENLIQIHDVGSIPVLEAHRLTEEEKSICNKKTLYIFLTDQVFYIQGPPFKILVKDYSSDEVIICENDNKVAMHWQDSDDFFSPELESIKKFIELNNLKNVTVCVNNTDPFNLLKKYNFNIKRIDPFLQYAADVVHKHKTSSQFINSEEIDTKLWCGNLRYEPHRHIVAAYLTNLDSLISWSFVSDPQNIKSFLWFDIDKWHSENPQQYFKLTNGLEKLNSKLWSIDFKPERIVLSGDISDISARPWSGYGLNDFPTAKMQSHNKLYQNTFCSVINESYFGRPFPVYSEKSLGAIANYRPFILVSPPYSLQMMKDDGFKTFDKFWDESYDLEVNHEKRLIKLFDLFDTINNMSIDECRKMHKEMMPILEYNRNLVTSEIIKFSNEK
jgi:hypothetical protein